jgi:hypothetical protein
MSSITASIVVNFDAGDAEGILTAEIDGRENGLNGGETSFRPGDSPAFLVYKSPNVQVNEIVASAGSISNLGLGSSEESELISFANVREASPRKPISSGLSTKWLGNNGGTVSLQNGKLTIPNKAVAVLKADYVSDYNAYRLKNVPEELNGETSFDIVIYISGSYI